jgi:hypothetical protein
MQRNLFARTLLISHSVGRDFRLSRTGRLLSLLIFLGLTSPVYAQLSYVVNSGTAVSITGYSGSGAVVIPQMINTSGTVYLPVASIASGAFQNQPGVTSVSIPSSVISIGSNAFYGCAGLTSAYFMGAAPSMGSNVFSGVASGFTVYYFNFASGFPGSAGIPWDGYASADFNYTITNGQVTLTAYGGVATTVLAPQTITSGTVNLPVTGIGANAFESASMASLTLPNTITSIGSGAFSESKLTSFTFPGEVGSVPANAFYECPSLSSIALGGGITSIGSEAFYNCTALASVSMSGSLTTIGYAAFNGCTKLNNVAIPDSVTSIGAGVFENCTGLTAITLGAGITSIPDDAFRQCTSLASINVSSSITSIGDYAFYGCGVASVTIPASVASIGSDAFYACWNLASIAVDPANPSYSSDNGVLFDKAQATLIQFPEAMGGAYTIPNGVINFGTAFSGNSVLTSITIPNSVTVIADSAFADCVSLGSVSIGNGVTSIGQSAFEDCDSLATVNIPNNVASIGANAFYGAALRSIAMGNGVGTLGAMAFSECAQLSSITIPNSVTSIGANAFHGCTSLASAYFMGNAPSMGSWVYSLTASNFTVYYFNGATGFTSPAWDGYTAVNIGDPTTAWLQSNGYLSNSNLQNNPSGDGVPLLVDYAFNLNPAHNESASIPHPVISGNTMSLTYFAGSVGVVYSVEASTDLRTWSTTGVTVSTPSSNNCCTATIPMTSPSSFMRIVVTH